jgi:hydroxymethylpyrimidine pyrophosphatase-like HAD family hydrolase
MLQAVGRGVLMGNAPNDLKEIITTHTLDNDSDGVYHALRDMNLI